MGDLCYKLLVTQLTKLFEAIVNSTSTGGLGHDRARFSVEVTYLRKDRDFVFI